MVSHFTSGYFTEDDINNYEIIPIDYTEDKCISLEKEFFYANHYLAMGFQLRGKTYGNKTFLNKKHTDEARNSMSINNVRYWKGKTHDDAYKKMMSEHCVGIKKSEHMKDALKKTKSTQWSDPEFRAKMELSNGNRKVVICTNNISGDVIEFQSISKCERVFGLRSDTIASKLRTGIHTISKLPEWVFYYK